MRVTTISFKDFDLANDVSTQLSTINEVISLTGSYFSGTDYYKKTFTNITSGSAVSGGFWQSFYDGSPTSTSSSALIDITYGHNSSSLNAGYSETFLNTEKKRVYEQMANYLLGSKNSLFTFNSIEYRECFFFLFKRRIFKDEIAKGNVTFNVQMTGSGNSTLSLTDTGAASSYEVGDAGDEADLISGSTAIGRVYYNAGIVVVATGAFIPVDLDHSPQFSGNAAGSDLNSVIITGTLDNIGDGVKDHLNEVTIHNQTNLHSTIYFARALNNEFNYSSNPTFIDSDGRIIPTSGTDNQTRSYITSVGLYDVNNNLLGVAKLSEPVKKSPDSELTIRIRLSY